MTLAEYPDMLDIKQVKAILRVAQSTAHRIVTEQGIKVSPRRYLISKAKLVRFIDGEAN